MSKPLDCDYLDEIEGRIHGATPGPWHNDHNNLEYGAYGCVSIGDHGWVCSGANTPAYDVDSEQGRDDAEFIAHARTDLPALLDEVRRLRGLVYRLAGLIEATGGPGSIKHSRMLRQYLNETEGPWLRRKQDDANESDSEQIEALTERIGKANLAAGPAPTSGDYAGWWKAMATELGRLGVTVGGTHA